MSLWQRLFGSRRTASGSATTPARRKADGESTDDSLRRMLRPLPPGGGPRADEELLVTYTRRIGVLDERPERCDPDCIAALERLWRSGHEAPAIALGGALASALPRDAELQLLVAGFLCHQHSHAAARPLLERARTAPGAGLDLVLRARSRLAEVASHTGDPVEAAAQLAAILVEDWNYPGARERLMTLDRAGAGSLDGAASGSDDPRAGAQLALLGARPGTNEGSHSDGTRAAPTLLATDPQRPQRGARYRLLRELGAGSTGAVYLAHDTELNAELALKLFHPRLTAQPDGEGAAEAMLRAFHEARVLAAVRHPGVLALYDLDEETRFLAMELCRGGALRQRLCRGPLPLAATLLRGGELLETLAAVHQTGVVHGDLKPENLLFRGRTPARRPLPDGEAQYGDLVISDFGLARLRALDEQQLGTGAAAPGTLAYMSPERFHGSPPSADADVYAVGAVLLEMLLGDLPLSRAEQLQGARLFDVLSDELLAPVAAVAGARFQPLRRLLAALLAPDPAARPDAASAVAMLREVAP